MYPGTAEFLRSVVVAVRRENDWPACKRPRLPIRRHRCAGLCGVHRCGFAGAAMRARGEEPMAIMERSIKPINESDRRLFPWRDVRDSTSAAAIVGDV